MSDALSADVEVVDGETRGGDCPGADDDDDDDDDDDGEPHDHHSHSLVQKLSPNKARKLEQASERRILLEKDPPRLRLCLL